MPWPTQAGSFQARHDLLGGHAARTQPDGGLHPVCGHVVVIPLEPPPGHAQQLREDVQLRHRDVADQMGPEPAVRRPPRRVDVEHAY